MNGKNMFGVMVDCSRNGVMRVEKVKELVDLLAKMGYNTLMLYTEDTFEVDNQPYFGYKRGRYSKNDMKELDAYCIEKGIELIPCIQTLAHLNCIFKWYDIYMDINDCDDILLVEEEKTYKLIDDIFATLSECFTTRKIHIGMDEANKVGLGKYMNKHGFCDRFEVINRHLHKVCELADKYNFEPMIWSDMFCTLATGTGYWSDKEGNFDAIKEKAALPENITLTYWDYYSKDYERYSRMLKLNKAFDRPVAFAGGAWTWKGFSPDNKYSIETTIPAIKACQDEGVNDILITIWGDDGNECSRFAVLPALFYTSELVKGNTDEKKIKEKFKAVIGMDFDDFCMLDALDTPGGMHNGHCPSKYLFYNDPINPILDYTVAGNENDYYKALKAKLEQINVPENYKKLFNSYISLCDLLSLKSELGVKTRRLYKEGKREELLNFAENEYNQVYDKIKAFYNAFKEFWLDENNPSGFDVQDIRFGGMLQRILSCRDRIISYCNGFLDEIPELNDEILPTNGFKTWGRTITPNVISHMV